MDNGKLLIVGNGQVLYFNTSSPQKVDAIGEAVVTGIDHTTYAGLYDELGALDAGRIGDVERGALGVVARTSNLGDGVGFGVEDVRLGDAVLFADIFEAGRCAVVAVADDHFVPHDECPYLTAEAITVLAPDASHA